MALGIRRMLMLMVDKNNWFMKMLYIRVDTQNCDASSVLTWDLNKQIIDLNTQVITI